MPWKWFSRLVKNKKVFLKANIQVGLSESSEREIGLLFPNILHADEDNVAGEVEETLDAGLENSESLSNRKYLEKYVVPTLMKGLGEMYVTRPRSPVEWLADWLSENNPNKMWKVFLIIASYSILQRVFSMILGSSWNTT